MKGYATALLLYERALAIREEILGPDHLDTAQSLNSLAVVHEEMEQHAKALPLYQRVFAIRERVLGPDHLGTAIAVVNLARSYQETGWYTEALPLLQRAQAFAEKTLGARDPSSLSLFNSLAVTYEKMGEYAKALSLHQQVLATREKILGPDHPDTAQTLNNMAVVHEAMGEYAKALSLHRRALAVYEKVLGPDHPDTAQSLNNLAAVYESIGNYPQALAFYERALAIREKVLHSDHPALAESFNNLASFYQTTGEYAKALPLCQRTLAIREKALGPEHPLTAQSFSNLAVVYSSIGNYDKALPLTQQALMIQKKVLGPDHPDTALSLNNLAMNYYHAGDYAKALSLHQRALMIREKVLGSNHPDAAQSLSNLAVLYQSTREYAKALQVLQSGLTAEDHVLVNVFSVASEEQKFLFAQKYSGPYVATLSLIHRHFSKDAQAVRFGLELVLRRKGIVLDAQARTQEVLAANLTGETLESWQRLTQHRGMLSRLLLSDPGKQNPEDYRKRIEELQADIAREEEFLAQHSGLVAQELAQRQVTAGMLAGRLPKDGTLVEFVRIVDWDEEKKTWSDIQRYLAFVLTPDNQATLVDLGEATKIDAKIHVILAAINPPDFERAMEKYSRQADTELAELYRLILQPVEAALGASCKRLIVSPDGELNRVPFAALRTPDDRYLVEQITVSYVSSGRDLLRGKTDVAPTVDLLLVANPAFDDGKVLQIAAIPRKQQYGLPTSEREGSLLCPARPRKPRLFLHLSKGPTRCWKAETPPNLPCAQ